MGEKQKSLKQLEMFNWVKVTKESMKAYWKWIRYRSNVKYWQPGAHKQALPKQKRLL